MGSISVYAPTVWPASEALRGGVAGRVFEEFLAGDVVVQRQEPVETLGELRILRSQSRELGGSLGRGEIQEPVQMRLQVPPALVFQARLSGLASRSSPRR